MTDFDARSLFIIKAGDTFEPLRQAQGDFEHWIARGLELSSFSTLPVRVVDPRRGESLPDAADCAGVVVSGSHAMVSHREAWSETTAAWLAQVVAQGTPVLGICYGHQLLAHALGGEAGDHPAGLEVGTVHVTLTGDAAQDALLRNLPTSFAAHVVHRQSALALPAGAVVLAGNAFEPHQAFRVGDCAWGVQFHPEFNADAMRGYIDTMADSLQSGGVDPVALRKGVKETPEAAGLLQRFAHIANAHATSSRKGEGLAAPQALATTT
ncbi:glutamine amidotransferase [Variovorax sp. J22R133]|uniref:glutamine amidotransferase n=1 Tax=Variovorax brevis TaxID=3053503 RepID=UPI002576E510|nr:glutamine amidotransferase [Variovorax sp. J22R133]MDM0112771.1 glutamine amidotransferase [Variovorax sp. J22R133]